MSECEHYFILTDNRPFPYEYICAKCGSLSGVEVTKFAHLSGELFFINGNPVSPTCYRNWEVARTSKLGKLLCE